MTLVDLPPAPVGAPADGPDAPLPIGRRLRTRMRNLPPVAPGRRVASTALIILAAITLGFALYVGLISQLHHDRAQHNAYADFRIQLAAATAPTGQTQPDHPKRLLVPGTPVAVLAIPKLHINEVVFEGTAGAVLENGPGHLRDSPLPGQAGLSQIFGRSVTYGGPFDDLSRLVPGDRITVTTGQGVQSYRVIDLRRAGDPQPPALASGAGRLMLATADGNPLAPSGVLRVDADLTSLVVPGAPTALSKSQLPPVEEAMAADPSAWYSVVLWCQALLASAALLAWARSRWGGWQTWIVAVPTIAFLGLAVADQAARLLPNLM